MSEYRIARVDIRAVDDGLLVEPTYYKVFFGEDRTKPVYAKRIK